MNTEKPKKRLVGWAEYANILSTKGLRISVAYALGCIGLGFITVGIAALVGLLSTGFRGSIAGIFHELGTGIVLGGMGLWMIRIARLAFQGVRQAEPVALLTKTSAKGLPEVETLVRGSHLPATAEQVELLRAARHSVETPPEQLLRAVQQSSQEV